jgi:hypothetical protein
MYVREDNKQILRIDITDDGFWSTPFHKRVKADIQITFSYYNETPFISSILSSYESKGIVHTNELRILSQKFDEFPLTKSEYWSFNEFSHNPFMTYEPKEWLQKNIPADPDYKAIERDLVGPDSSLEEHFITNSGKWFFGADTSGERTQKKINDVRKHFLDEDRQVAN